MFVQVVRELLRRLTLWPVGLLKIFYEEKNNRVIKDDPRVTVRMSRVNSSFVHFTDKDSYSLQN